MEDKSNWYPLVDSPMNRAQRAGHRAMKGHELVAHLEPTDVPGIMKLVRECCPDED